MKIIRLLKWPFFILLFLSFGLAFVLATESGLRLLVAACDSLAGPAFSAARADGRFVESWRLEKVRVYVDGIIDIELDELRCSWRPVIFADRKLQLSQLTFNGLVLRLPDSDDETSEAVILPDIEFPFALGLDDFQVHDAAIYFADTKEPLIINELNLRASGHAGQLTIDRLMLDSPDYGGELQGRLQLRDNWPLTARGRWRVADPGIGELRGRLNAAGDLAALTVSIDFETPAAARVEGQLTDILNDLHWQASGETQYFSLSDIQVDLPAAGTLTVVQASGTLESYGGTLTADIQYQGYPQVQARAEVQGDYDGLSVSVLSFLLDREKLTTRGKINWQDGFSWQAEVQGRQLNPGRFSADWSGAVDTVLQSRGEWTADGLTAAVHIESLQGVLRGFPVSGSGRAGYENETLRIDALQLQSGSSSFRVHGSAGKELELSFQAGSDDLASLIPQGSGVFDLEGTLSGSRRQPRLTMTVRGSELNAAGAAVQSLQADVDADLSVGGSIDADVAIKGAEVRGQTISRGSLQVRGSLEEHQLNLSFAGSPGELRFAAHGGLQEQQWQGAAAKLFLETARFGTWKTEQPFSLLLAEKRIEVARFTLGQDKARISMAGKWQDLEGWQMQGDVENFALHLLSDWKLVPQKLDGILTASMTAAGRGTFPEQAEFSASVPEISLAAENEEGAVEAFRWSDNRLQVNVQGNRAGLTAQSLFQDGSTANLALTAANCCERAGLDEIPLDGRLDVNLADISPLAPLSSYMLTGKGRLAGSFSLQGTAARPALQGGLALADGEITIPAAGITLQEAELAVTGDADANKVVLTLVSDGSRLQAEGGISQGPQNQWQADFSVQGHDFPAVQLSEYQAKVSPDLRFVYGQKGAELSGTVTVAQALLAPMGFSGSVSSSRDVVVVDADGARQENNGIPLYLDLEVVLGEAVQVDAFGVKGFLDGRLKIQQQPGQVMTGLGSLNLRAGTFVFKDRELTVDRGLVFYQGGPLDDPGLDVRAGKEIDDIEVGIQLTGTVSRMEMNLFSSSRMDESDILAYLLTGKDMSASSSAEGSMLGAAAGLGIGGGGDFLKNITEETGFDVSLATGEEASDVSLVVGREIYKDLYISYGKGLTDSTGTFKARYKLKYGFSVETETTSEATGTDLFWSMER